MPYTLPGECWRVELGARSGGIWRGKAIEPVRLCPRKEPVCRHFGDCGGCSLQHLSVGEYDELKRNRIAQALQHRGIGTLPMPSTLKSPPGSRRRLRLAFDGQGQLGLRSRASKRVVQMMECPIAHPELIAALTGLTEWTRRLGGAGEVTLTKADNGLDVYVISSKRPSGEDCEGGRKLGWTRLSWAVEAGGHPETLFQQALPRIALAGIPIALPPGVFLQATTQGEQALQNFVRAHIGTGQKIADYFCGLGTLALACAGNTVSAFDADGPAIRELWQTGMCHHVEQRDLWADPPSAKVISRFDIAILDPPRAGAKALCQELAKADIASLIYVSCEPATFARDAQILQAGSWRLDSLQPVDQFLYSPDIELCALFRRR